MSEINKGDLIVVQLRSGMVVLGKMGAPPVPPAEPFEGTEVVEKDYIIVDAPRVLQPVQRGPNPNSMALVEFVGRPTEMEVLRSDIYFLYPNKDGNLIADYIKSTTGLSLASVIPTKQ
jgi:hypothetical protein